MRIVVIGGGVIGSSIAFHLRSRDSASEVFVVERDPTYRRASSQLAMGGIRQQFSSRANIGLAQYSVRFYRQFDIRFGRLQDARANFQQRGYLFLVNEETADRFEARLSLQRSLGAHVARLEVDQVHRLVPDLVLDDIQFGVFGPQDGYADPRAVLSGLRHAGTAVGARNITDDVVGVDEAGGAIGRIALRSGREIEADVVVCAAGAFSAAVGRMVDVNLPIRPVRQQLFRCTLPKVWPYRFPVVVDPTGVHWRHQDPTVRSDPDRIVVARTKHDEPPGENFTCDDTRWAPDYRDPLVARIPALAPIELEEGWAGLYEMTDDHNPLIGEHPDVSGFYVAAGFSGHGLMMAPAVGNAVAELILDGRSTSLDIEPFGVARFSTGQPFVDDAII